MLSRTEDLKCTLMKVGGEYGLPLDLMKQVYRFKVESEEEDRDRERIFQKNVILMTILGRPGDGWVESLGRIWLNRYKRLTKQFNFEEEDVYEERLKAMPEWSFWINGSPQVAQKENGPQMGNRGRLMKCIKILGEEGYLWEAIYDVQSNSHVISHYEPCSLKRKIKYLNTSCWDEIGNDYDDFVTDAYASRLCVDSWGDSYYLD